MATGLNDPRSPGRLRAPADGAEDSGVRPHIGLSRASAFAADVVQGFFRQTEPFLLGDRSQSRPFFHRPAADNIGNCDAGLDQLGDAFGVELDHKVIADMHGEDLVSDAEGVRVHTLGPSGMGGLRYGVDIERPGELLEWVGHLYIVRPWPWAAQANANFGEPACPDKGEDGRLGLTQETAPGPLERSTALTSESAVAPW